MSKRDKKTAKPNIAPAALLRARLERLWLSPAAPAPTDAELSAATRGLKPEVVLEGVLSVFQAAPPETQAQLEGWLPGWLGTDNRLPGLVAQLEAGHLPAALEPTAGRWLAAAGQAVSLAPADPTGGFHSAYVLDGEWQSAVTLFWYSDRHRQRVSGFQVLIDRNPPWNGALKDIFQFPSKSPRALLERYVNVWQERGQAMTPIEAGPVKRQLLQAIIANWEADVRLPAALVALREPFFQHVLTLPDLPDTPALSAEVFDTMSQAGQSAEAIAHFEQTVGRRVLMDDGRELLIDASLANGQFDDEEGEADGPMLLES